MTHVSARTLRTLFTVDHVVVNGRNCPVGKTPLPPHPSSHRLTTHGGYGDETFMVRVPSIAGSQTERLGTSSLKKSTCVCDEGGQRQETRPTDRHGTVPVSPGRSPGDLGPSSGLCPVPERQDPPPGREPTSTRRTLPVRPRGVSESRVEPQSWVFPYWSFWKSLGSLDEEDKE